MAGPYARRPFDAPTAGAPPSGTRFGRPFTDATGRTTPMTWRWQHHPSIVGCLLLAWGAWTVTVWLLGDPHSITEYRDPRSAAFTIAKIYEVAIVLLSVAVARHVIRGLLRERRFTFDAQLCVAGALAFWIDHTRQRRGNGAPSEPHLDAVGGAPTIS